MHRFWLLQLFNCILILCGFVIRIGTTNLFVLLFLSFKFYRSLFCFNLQIRYWWNTLRRVRLGFIEDVNYIIILLFFILERDSCIVNIIIQFLRIQNRYVFLTTHNRIGTQRIVANICRFWIRLSVSLRWRSDTIKLGVRLFWLRRGGAPLSLGLPFLTHLVIKLIANDHFDFIKHMFIKLAHNESYCPLHSLGNFVVYSVVNIIEKLVYWSQILVKERFTKI